MTVKELLILLTENDIKGNVSIYTGYSVNEKITSIDIWTDEFFKKSRTERDTNV